MSGTPKKRAIARFAVLLLFLGFLVAVFLFALSSPTRTVQLSDGSTLELLGVSRGTNAFLHGSPIERMLGDRIPAQGLSILGWKLKRPVSLRPMRFFDQPAPLTVWIQFIPSSLPSGNAASPNMPSREAWRVIAANGSGRRLENEPPVFLGKLSKTNLLQLALDAFPRDERTIHLKILAPRPGSDQHDLAEFKISNPFRSEPPGWSPTALPASNTIDGIAIVLEDVGTSFTQVRFRLPSEDWQLVECRITDEEGNTRSRSSLSTRRIVETSFAQANFKYGLESNRLWKIQAKFVRAPGWPRAQSFDFPAEERITVRINPDGTPVDVTNSFGREYVCRLDAHNLFIRNQAGSIPSYLVLLAATNDQGKQVSFYGTHGTVSGFAPGSMQTREIWQIWRMNEPLTNLTLHLACPKTITTEFHVKPGD